MNQVTNPRQSFKPNRNLYFRIGFAFSLLITFTAFEWRTAIPRTEAPPVTEPWDQVETQEMPLTYRNIVLPEPPLPAPSKPSALPPKSSTGLHIVPNNPISDPGPESPPSDSLLEIHTREIDTLPPDPVYIAEIAPQFPGGEKELIRFMSENTRYPESEHRKNNNGIAYVNFVIDNKGQVTDITCLKSTSAAFAIEAKRVVSSMPRWIPGIQNGKKVSVRMMLPVSFRLIE